MFFFFVDGGRIAPKAAPTASTPWATRGMMSEDEAMKVLNVTKQNTWEEIEKNYLHLFEANEKVLKPCPKY